MPDKPVDEAVGGEVATPVREKSDHVCQRCGLCCQGKGDFAFDLDDLEPEYEPDDCTALVFENGLAVCRLQDCKRDCCKDYPFILPDSTDPLDFMCERELKQAGFWQEYMHGTKVKA